VEKPPFYENPAVFLDLRSDRDNIQNLEYMGECWVLSPNSVIRNTTSILPLHYPSSTLILLQPED
jgi:hypothetical protein